METTAKITTEEVERVFKTTENFVTLKMPLEEAEVLNFILRSVGGLSLGREEKQTIFWAH
jgi:hypothetical protein